MIADYEETGSGRIEDEIRSEIGSTAIFNKGSEEVSFRRRQEEDQMIDEETKRTKMEVIKEVQDDVELIRRRMVDSFEENFSQSQVPDFEGTDYLQNVENLSQPISEMNWYQEREVPEDVYDRQMKIIEDNIKDI